MYVHVYVYTEKKEDIDESTPLYKSVQQKKSEILDTTVKVSDRVHHKKQVENGATGITGTPLTPHSQQKQQEENDGAERPIDGHIPDLWEELNDKYHKDLQVINAYYNTHSTCPSLPYLKSAITIYYVLHYSDEKNV